MNRPSRRVAASDLDVEAVLDESSLRLEIMSEVRRRWDEGQALDAKAFLEQHPDLGSQKSVVLDLAFEEYCQKTENGELVDTDAYCRQYPTFEKSLRRLIAVQDYLDQNTHLMPAEVDWPQIGQVFQGFHLLAELGRGAFARVFLAQQVALGNRLVAVKVSTDGAGEADILGRLQHPSIVPVYSLQQDDETGLAFVCMPYLGRTTLCDLLDRLFGQKTKPVKARSILEAIWVDSEEFPVADEEACAVDSKLRSGSFVDGAVHLGRQLAEALAYSHSNGVCHSDLKPSNVLIGPGGRPMLLDFNLAFQPRSTERRLGGTLPYMAPEQLRALAASPADWPPPVDERSDVFSLGVILYELLTGSLPFGPIQTNLPRGEISARLLEKQKLGPGSLRESNGNVDAPLAELVESCLAFEPADRPQTAEELAAALRRHGSPLRRTRRWTRRNALLLGLSAAFLLAIGSVPAYRWWTFDPFLAGMEHLRLEQYARAEQRFTEAIASNRDSSDYYYWRARSRQLQGDYHGAVRDYELAKDAAQYDPARKCRCLASMGYCSAMSGVNSSCVHFSEEAIKASKEIEGGKAIEDRCLAAVYNNLGYGYRMERVYGHSLESLGEAIALDIHMGPAYHNRAFVFLHQAADASSVDPQARADIDKAIEIGPPSPWLHFDAAVIHDCFERRSGKAPEQTTYHAKEALRLGVDPKKVCQAFPFLCEDSRPEDVSARSGYVPFRQIMEILLVDPFPHHSLDAR